MIKLLDIINELIATEAPFPGYIGLVSSHGHVTAKYVDNVTFAQHSELTSGYPTGRWRFYIKNPESLLYWSDEPNEDERIAVENWLAKKGKEVKRQVDNYADFSRYLKE